MCVGVCSDGVSRTGTFLTIHCQVERLKTEGVVDFLQAIKSARLQRPGLVSNTVSKCEQLCDEKEADTSFSLSLLFQDHYVFCHEVVNTYLDNFDTYANFEFKQLI